MMKSIDQKNNKIFTHIPMNIGGKQGFTLIEVLLYIAITVTIITATISFLFSILQLRIKSNVIADVEQQGIQVMQQVLSVVRNADGVIFPAQGLNDSFLVIDALGTVNDPTTFNELGGVFQIQEGAGPFIHLTNSHVIISGLNFYNLSKTDTSGTVKISFTVTYINPEGRNEYNYSKSFTGSASLR